MDNKFWNMIGMGIHHTIEFIGNCIRWYFLWGAILDSKLGESETLQEEARNSLQGLILILNVLWILAHMGSLMTIIILSTEGSCQ